MKKFLHILPLMIALLLTACKAEIDDVHINAPVVTLGEVSEVTGNSAVIQENIKQQGGKVSYCLIRYGTSQTSLTETERYDVSSENVRLKLPSLQANTTYYFQVVVSSGYSEVESEVRSFTTLNPAVALSEASAVTATTALFQAQLHLEGSTPISCTLRYGTDVLSMTHSVAITDVQEDIEIPLSSLVIGTNYYCQFVVNLGGKVLKSELKFFTTLNPVVSLSEAMNVTSSSVSLQVSISTGSEGNPECVLRYGTDASLLTAEIEIQNEEDILLTSLDASTTYFIQLIAHYGSVEIASDVKRFSTSERSPQDPIVFADPQVERICVEYWDVNGDGSLSYQEASLVNSLEDRFKENVDINMFDELKYFYGLKEVGGFADCLFLEHITIPYGVVTVLPDAFLRCSNLKGITISETVTAIEWEAFSGCSNLTDVTLPESLTSISARAFFDCSSLAYIHIPESVLDIGENAFWNCIHLKSISIPKQIERIRKSVFGNCISLEQIEIPYGVKVLEVDAFVGCSSLSSISIPETVVVIGKEVFAGCSRLNSITIPEGVKSIEDHTFAFCDSLVSIEIPANVTSIGRRVFDLCSNLKSVFVQATVPPTIDDEAFQNTDCTIYVSAESVEAYQKAWPTYAYRIKAIP